MVSVETMGDLDDSPWTARMGRDGNRRRVKTPCSCLSDPSSSPHGLSLKRSQFGRLAIVRAFRIEMGAFEMPFDFQLPQDESRRPRWTRRHARQPSPPEHFRDFIVIASVTPSSCK